MIGRTIGILGLFTSIMALSSLIYGAFHEPLVPYMQGIVGGTLEAYRTMRDFIFESLGSVSSGLINFIGQWLKFLPPAPWFSLPLAVHDLLTIYFIIGGATYRAVEKVDFSPLYEELPSSPDDIRNRRFFFNNFNNPSWFFLLYIIILWPVFVPHLLQELNLTFEVKYQRLRVSSDRDKRGVPDEYLWFRIWRMSIALSIIGSILFFLLAYAEKEMGLK